MIEFNYETNFKLDEEERTAHWIRSCIDKFSCKEGEINFIFCTDDYLHDINLKFLNHDTLTDIISFDYSIGKELSGDIFISVERVVENAEKFRQTIENEIHRVIIHGILHFAGFKDDSPEEKQEMRSKEDTCLNLLK